VAELLNFEYSRSIAGILLQEEESWARAAMTMLLKEALLQPRLAANSYLKFGCLRRGLVMGDFLQLGAIFLHCIFALFGDKLRVSQVSLRVVKNFLIRTSSSLFSNST
jgi:hypothetical protein